MNKSTLRVVQPKRLHARDLARAAVARYQRGTAIEPDYDFTSQPRELKEIFYNHAVWFSCRRWYVRFFWWR